MKSSCMCCGQATTFAGIVFARENKQKQHPVPLCEGCRDKWERSPEYRRGHARDFMDFVQRSHLEELNNVEE